ncbi:tetratricopeptide repeat protein [Flagellimonas meishanensis]|uniref:tetratricopeptide repeat protein n=1 Tax=Flagellimonas meishanensis TaxID=2873264 RepID=UPI001CA616E4|nr:tetratricopeptide repeat protein [[Muricauda] meishanensis]
MKYLNGFLFLTIVLSTSLYGQNQDKIDSLTSAYKKQKEDTLKVQTIKALFNAYLYSDPEVAKKFAQEQLALSRKIGFEKGVASGLYNLGVYHSNLDNIDSSRIYYQNASKKYNQLMDLDGLTGVNHGLAILEYSEGNYSKALGLLDKNIKLYSEEVNDSSGLAMTYDFIGSINMYMGNHNIALKETLKALNILEKIDEEIRKADALNHLAAIEFYLHNFEESIDYNFQALQIYRNENDRYFEAQALNDIGNTYYYLEEYEKAIEILGQSLDISTEMGIVILQATAFNNLGKTHAELEQFQTAISYLEKSLSILENTNNRNKTAEVLNDIGNVYNAQNKPELAITYLNKSIALADSIQARENLKNGFFYRSNSYENMGNYKMALTDFKNYKSTTDSIFDATKSKQIEELRTIYETEKKEAEIALQQEEIKTLNEKAKVDKLTKGLYAGGMASALALFGLSVFGYRQRIKKNKIAREKQEEIFRQEIEHKKKELASQTLHLVQKNTFIQELKENLESLKNSPEKFKVEFRRIVMLLKKEKASDKDWETFKTYFSEVHNDFDQKLKTIYADISEKEIRLAAFLRMNLTTKEIAATMNVLPDSILKSKYRLKKKFGLDKETDLNSFLNTL